MSEFIVSIFLVFLLRLFFPVVFLLTGRTMTASDGVSHICTTVLMRRNGHRPFVRMPRTEQSGENYPWLYSWILSFLPERLIMSVSLLTGTVIDTLLYGLLVFVMKQSGLVPFIDQKILFLFAALFVFTPHLTRLTTGRIVPRPRPLGVLLGNLLFLFLWSYLSTDLWIWYCAAILVYVPLCLTSKFAVQAAVSISVLLGIFTGKLLLLVFPVLAIGFSVLITWGQSWVLFVGQIRHSVVYWKKNYEFVREKNTFTFPRKMNLSEIKRCLYVYSENSFILVLTGLPFLIPLFLLYFRTSHLLEPNVQYLFVWIMAALTVMLMTSFWKFKVFGQAERYLDFALFPYFLLLFAFYSQMSSLLLVALLAYGFLMYIIHLIVHIYAYGTPKGEVRKQIEGYQWLNRFQDELKVISIPYTLSRYGLMYTKHVYPFTQGIPKERQHEFELIYSKYPYPPHDMKRTIEHYNIDFVVKKKKKLKQMSFHPLENCVFENSEVAVYDVRENKTDVN